MTGTDTPTPMDLAEALRQGQMPERVTEARYVNPEGHPAHLMSPCERVGPYGWINNLGNVVPIKCNRPRAHAGDHGYSTKREAMKYRWPPSSLTIHSTCMRGPWEVVERVG